MTEATPGPPVTTGGRRIPRRELLVDRRLHVYESRPRSGNHFFQLGRYKHVMGTIDDVDSFRGWTDLTCGYPIPLAGRGPALDRLARLAFDMNL